MPPAATSSGKLLTVRLGRRRYGLDAARVREVARMPRLTRVPGSPPALLGLASVRGAVLPVLSLARLLGGEDSRNERVIVFDAGERVALAVGGAEGMARSGGRMREVDVAALVAASLPRRQRRMTSGRAAVPVETVPERAAIALLGFAVAGQEFALPLTAVDEVLPLPAEIAVLPHADEAVVGSVASRGATLPLLSLRALLALPGEGDGARASVVVARIGGHRVGLVVDALRPVLRLPASAIDPLPAALARNGAEARIQAVCRLGQGTRLVSVLAAEQLLDEALTHRLLSGGAREQGTGAAAVAEETGEPFLLFRAGEERFGLPVAAVERVMPMPERLAPLPNAPEFVAGVIQWGGRAVPVIDQARRFGAARQSARRKIIVARAGALRAALLVHEVEEVARFPQSALAAAPGLGERATQVFDRVAVDKDGGRIVLLVDPHELLDQAGQDLLREYGKS